VNDEQHGYHMPPAQSTWTQSTHLPQNQSPYNTAAYYPPPQPPVQVFPSQINTTDLIHEVERLRYDNEHLRDTIINRNRELSHAREEAGQARRKHESQAQTLEELVSKLMSSRIELEKEKEGLRSIIANIKQPETQIRSDDYYIKKLERLNRDIQSLMANLFVGRELTMSKQNGEEVIQNIRDINEVGRRTATILQNSLWARHWNDSRKRVAFTRHISALLLYEYVFGRLVFGLHREESTWLKGIENSIIAQGNLLVVM